jgi:hypothetical protein
VNTAHEDKIQWMINWAHRNKVRLELEGECGFGRECVGILADSGSYPDYDDCECTYIPEDAYHKHPCVAVLGRGEKAESQLYEWLKWFEDNNFTVEAGMNESFEALHPVDMLLGKQYYARMVKKTN